VFGRDPEWVSVGGKPLDVPEKFIWKGVMLQDLPNAAFVIGYTSASWTLGASTTAKLVCRLLKNLDKNRQTSVVPRLEDGEHIKPMPLLSLNSTYVEKARGMMPKAGNAGPWKPRQNYLTDY
jgi:cation diffusion facilitator CzcD-associated flavoprotein CzcO